jgi:hypothetical protein
MSMFEHRLRGGYLVPGAAQPYLDSTDAALLADSLIVSG